jgi:membrane protein implicated in regulation of membrane protease activity
LDYGGSGFASFFKPKLISAFLVVTGGVGLILEPHFLERLGFSFVLVVSAFGGMAVAGLIYRFIMIPMEKAQNTSAFNIQDTIGCIAHVIERIPQGGYGKIKYSISGSTVTSPAKTEDGGGIATGEAVEIIYVENSTYYVRKKN